MLPAVIVLLLSQLPPQCLPQSALSIQQVFLVGSDCSLLVPDVLFVPAFERCNGAGLEPKKISCGDRPVVECLVVLYAYRNS